MKSIFITFAATFFLMSTVVNPQTVATINGRDISQYEIDATVTAQLLPLEQQIYALRKAALENFITRSLLEAEAKRRGISLDALKKLLSDVPVSIPAEEVERAYEENASAFAQMSSDEAKERIRLDMETQARIRAYRDAITKLRQSAQVSVRLKEPLLPVAVKDGGEIAGNEKATVNFVEYADFTCGYCREAAPTVKNLIAQYKRDVKFVFKHLPLSPRGEALSRAAHCAGKQGKFWEYHDSLFSSTNLTPTALNDLAIAHKLDEKQFSACLSSPASLDAIRKDAAEAKRLGIDGTPAFIINGKLITGALSFEEFKTIIENSLLNRAEIR